MGVFPKGSQAMRSKESLPHARGGVSITLDLLRGWGVSSPRSWGCFLGADTNAGESGVFPTLVGVFLRTGNSFEPRLQSSPRSWGCFSKRNEYRRSRFSLPHARGGVSVLGWGGNYGFQVFPTLVGVFLRPKNRFSAQHRLPHARGGVSCYK